jgi:hypothetical protein
MTNLPNLSYPNQEEADTRIFAHIKYCVDILKYTRVVIQATDTDIIIMAVYFIQQIDGLQELWVQKFNFFIPCHQIAAKLSSMFLSHTR